MNCENVTVAEQHLTEYYLLSTFLHVGSSALPLK